MEGDDYSQEGIVVGVAGLLAYDDRGLLVIQFEDDEFCVFG